MKKPWPTPCEDEFAKMARDAPLRLIAWIESETLDFADKSHALLELGQTRPKEIATLAMHALLHPSPVVREGAVLGLCAMRTEISEILDRVANTDPSEGVRKTANDHADERLLLLVQRLQVPGALQAPLSDLLKGFEDIVGANVRKSPKNRDGDRT